MFPLIEQECAGKSTESFMAPIVNLSRRGRVYAGEPATRAGPLMIGGGTDMPNVRVAPAVKIKVVAELVRVVEEMPKEDWPEGDDGDVVEGYKER